MVKIKEIPINDRPIEKLITNGVETLTNEELLAILLNTGYKDTSVKELASTLISKANGIENLKTYTFQKYKTIKGIGNRKASVLLAALEFSKRVNKPIPDIYQTKITSSLKVVEYYQAMLYEKNQEYFCCLYLDIKKKVIKNKILFVGSLTYSMVHPREIFKEAYLIGASSIICIHNHPTNNVEPSKNDIDLTHQLLIVSTYLGVKLEDHIIIGKDKYYSFFENGTLK